MTTGKNKPPPRKGAKPSAATKPRAIIEGSAKDVTPKAKKEETSAKKSTPKPTQSAEPKSAPEAAPAHQPRSRPFGALIAAGLVGSMATLALMALLISIDGPQRSWLARATGAEEAARLAAEANQMARSSAARLEKAIAAQQSQVTDMQARLAETTTLSGEMTDIAARLEGLGEIPAQATALALRLQAAETRLDTLAANAATRGETVNSLARALDQAAKAGTSTAATTAALELAILRLDDAEVQLARLDDAIATMGQTTPADVNLSRDIQTRLTALSQKVEALAATMSSERTGLLAANFNQLKSTIADGRSYADLLVPFAQNPAAAGLAEFAATGAPSIASLRDGLADLRRRQDGAAEIEGTLGRITSLFGGAIKVRRTSKPAGPEDPLTIAEKALDAGNLDRAADTIDQAMTGPEADAWVAAARARAQIDKALAALEASLTSPAGSSGE